MKNNHSPTPESDQPTGTDLIPFATGILTQGSSGTERRLNDTELTAMLRACVDATPEGTQKLLQSISDVKGAVTSVLDWMNHLEETDQSIILNKLRGLIQALAARGELKIFLQDIKDYHQVYKSKSRGKLFDTLVNLAATDTACLQLLLEAAQDDLELLKNLLRIQNYTNTDNMLSAAAYFGNEEAANLILDAVEKADMLEELFFTGAIYH